LFARTRAVIDRHPMRESSKEATKRVVGDPSSEHDRLIALWDDGSASIDLPVEGQVAIGRGDECDLRIGHASVSRHHAMLHVGTSARIEDLGSSNGTIMAGHRLEPHRKYDLAPDVLVRVGEVLLVLRPSSAEARPEGVPEPRSPTPEAEGIPAAVSELTAMAVAGPLPVIILGETGVGKGVLAEAIHRRSVRRAARLVRLNCAALPEALLESELFGHERGAFTGAVQAKPGLLEAADRGTLLLDEIGELPPATQAKLLHVVEHGEVLRVGGLRPRSIDVRFIAATNRNLEALVAEGHFRQDLFFRLAGITIEIPPLRERRDEIPALARSMLAEACARLGRAAPEISEEVMTKLVEHRWPGNVRELRNAMARTALMGRTDLSLLQGEPTPQKAHPAPERPTPAPEGCAPTTDPIARKHEEIRALEKQRVLDALTRAGGNQTKAARELRISRRTLTKRMTEFQLPRPRKR